MTEYLWLSEPEGNEVLTRYNPLKLVEERS
jgi:hypothetical protein